MSTKRAARRLGLGAQSDFATALGREIRRLRLARGLTQAELGRPYSRAFVSLVEAGLSTPSLGALVLISARLGVAPGDLLAQSLPGDFFALGVDT